MLKSKHLNWLLASAACVALSATAASANGFNIPAGDLETALNTYSVQAGVPLIVSDQAVKGIRTRGVSGDLTANAALTHILAGTGFVAESHSAGTIAIVRHAPQMQELRADQPVTRVAAAAAAGIESVVVTSSKIKGDIQTVPIAITALSQEQLTSRQIAGGPDLVKEVPNLTFTKTNFAGYSIQIRGIGTQAISVTTDPAVAVAFNDTPFIRNHFFEQEFYDVSQVEILRGPQGTLYGRNATAGVVNMVSAKPTDQFEAMASADFGNYHNRRFEGMINVPISDDRLDIRAAAEWTKRDGYSFNSYTNAPIDGRDLWSSRVTIGWKPAEDVQAYLVWEHFSENDNRLRSGKQLCKTDYGPGAAVRPDGIDTVDINGTVMTLGPGFGLTTGNNGNFFLQGCVPSSLYSPAAFAAPLGYALPYVLLLQGGNPYASETQSHNLREINSSLNPIYRAKNDTLEFNADYNLTPSLTFTSQTGYNQDFLWSTEDFNRFGAAPGFFGSPFCDPQLGCSDRLIVEDLSDEHSWQLSQEFRLASNFSGPLNFSVGGNYLHYETLENYYVFINAISFFDAGEKPPYSYQYNDPNNPNNIDYVDVYTDPNPLATLNGQGHNYFRNENPYTLNSYAGFGEAYYNVTSDLKLIGGLRWTDDRKHFLMIPSWIADIGYGYPVAEVLDQQWNQLTGRAVANWSPKLDLTDQTLVYGSYSHGYKAGGANPPGAILPDQVGAYGNFNPTHPLTFKPEFVDAYELGTKNTLLDGGITLNGDVFFYNYKAYQVSEIVDRTAINHNYDATVKGAELESTWEASPGLKFSFAGGYEATRIDNGQTAVDLMDRTAGHSGWYISKPFITQASNCILPGYVAQYLLHGGGYSPGPSACEIAYDGHLDPMTDRQYKASPDVSGGACYNAGGCPADYAGFDPLAGTPDDPYHGQNVGDFCVQNCDGTGSPVYHTFDYGPVPNGGTGFSKNLGGNQLPNAPHFTTSLSADYTLPVSEDWAATLHGDFYWQSQSWWRVFNDKGYDKLRGYSNVNAALILTSASGWQVLGYVKNIFNSTAITGAFLNSDDTGLTTNVFLTDPRLYGVRITKNW
ncbi:MAG TPA: TonB-dependent receptor [Rhizomicrobium sp.]|nr:TonB-dependent receptor [Rhizomicrobium sp.]